MRRPFAQLAREIERARPETRLGLEELLAGLREHRERYHAETQVAAKSE